MTRQCTIAGVVMLQEAVQTATQQPAAMAAVEQVYADLQRQIDLRKPICKTSGRCCRFDEFGHRLYVTTLELAAFARGLIHFKSQISNLQFSILSPPAACPFQLDGLCSVHSIRPFGCRVFFCDATSNQWQHEQYEHFHATLKQLHERFSVPYRYVEWRQALRELNLSPPPDAANPPGRLSLPQLRL